MFICYLTSVFVMFIAGTTDATGAAATGQGAPIAGGVRFGLSQAANLDNSWTFEGHENEHDPQVDTRAPLASRRSFDAERTGFVRLLFATCVCQTRYGRNCFAGRRLRLLTCDRL